MTTDREPGVRCCIPMADEGLEETELDRITDALELLAHPIRFRLLEALARSGQPACVCDLETLVPVKQPTVSHHLKLLRSAGLVESERRGHWMYYSALPSALDDLRTRIRTGLDALETPQ